jgi:DHA2 family multidrug resistance protein
VAPTYPDPSRRFLMTLPAMIASTLVAVDTTIANVALPHMQASLSASADQIVWVLTSYLIACAIATPLSGWLASRFGRRTVMAGSVLAFSLASALCGAANDLTTLVVARAVQGASGAALIPLSQALLLDVNPPDKLARAMAVFSLGTMAGPIVGPVLGGWLTDTASWRWVFLINVPLGLLSAAGMLAFMEESRRDRHMRFDMFGFLMVSAALAALQLMLDRGEQRDWFDSVEIQLYAVVLGVAAYLSAVHILTARDTFLKPELFRDRNFAVGSVMRTILGVTTFASVPIIVVMTQNLLGYSALRTGIIGVPRAVGSIIGTIAIARVMDRVDSRYILFAGLVASAISMWGYAHVDLSVDQTTLIWIGLIQGVSGGLIFMPLMIMVFVTLPGRLRNEGAAMIALTGNIGSAVGLSLVNRELIHDSAASRAQLVEGVRPDNPIIQSNMPDFDVSDLGALARLSGEITRQASMVGNVQAFYILFYLSLIMMPLVLMMRTPKPGAPGARLPAIE